MAIFNEKDEITPTYIFFHFLRVSSRFFASGKVQTILRDCSPFHPLPIFFHFLPPIWFFGAGTFLLFLCSSTFFLLPFGFPVPVPFCPTTFFYFIFLPPRCRYYFLLFCFHSTALHSTLCFSVCVYQ